MFPVNTLSRSPFLCVCVVMINICQLTRAVFPKRLISEKHFGDFCSKKRIHHHICFSCPSYGFAKHTTNKHDEIISLILQPASSSENLTLLAIQEMELLSIRRSCRKETSPGFHVFRCLSADDDDAFNLILLFMLFILFFSLVPSLLFMKLSKTGWIIK